MKKSGGLILILMATTFFSGFYISNLLVSVKELKKKNLLQEATITHEKLKVMEVKSELLDAKSNLRTCEEDNKQLAKENIGLKNDLQELKNAFSKKEKESKNLTLKLTALQKDSQSLAFLNHKLDSQILVKDDRYAGLFNTHKRCQEARSTTIYASIAPQNSKVKKNHIENHTKVDLPESFGRITLYTFTIILLFAISVAGIQGLVQRRKRKKRLWLR